MDIGGARCDRPALRRAAPRCLPSGTPAHLRLLTMSTTTAATRSFAAKHKDIYASASDCQRYDCELCQRQDHSGAMLAAMRDVAQISRCTRAADVGAGTGKIARILAPHVGSVMVTDRSAEAISVARNIHGDGSSSGCALRFDVADLRTLPMESGSVDLVVAGWAVSYLKSEHEVWYADGSSGGPWREEVNAALAELDRILAPGGTLVIFETMGTATEASQRSGSWLYRHFRDECGFSERSIRTDYAFPSKRVALDTLHFFFGKGVATRAERLLSAVPAEGEECIVPEVTGMWWRRKEHAAPQETTGLAQAPPEDRGHGPPDATPLPRRWWWSWRVWVWLTPTFTLEKVVVGGIVVACAAMARGFMRKQGRLF